MKYLGAPQSGSQANTTASRGAQGQYYRNRSMPTQPRTAAQVAVRSSLATFSQTWKTLTDAQRDAWKVYAEAHPRVDSLGSTIKLSGMMAYIGVNNSLAIAARPPVVDPPTYVSVETPTVIFDGIPVVGTIDLEIGPTDPLAYTVLQCSPPRSPGVTFNNDFRFIGVQLNDDTLPTVWDIRTLIVAKYGALAIGQKFFLQFYNINGFGVTNALRRLQFTLLT